jgi:hypothetical protein
LPDQSSIEYQYNPNGDGWDTGAGKFVQFGEIPYPTNLNFTILFLGQYIFSELNVKVQLKEDKYHREKERP